MASLTTKLGAIVALTATALVISFAIPSAPTPTTDGGQALVAVTAYPLLDIVRSVAGPRIPVTSILPPGGNAHTFEPTPATVAALSRVRAVYAIGHGFDDWVDGVLRETRAEKVLLDAGIALRETTEAVHDAAAEEDPGHAEGPVDPHYWLDGRNAATMARNVAADLTLKFPGESASIAANLATTLARFDAADKAARETISAVPNRRIVTLHDAWYYFADAYGLEIVGSFEPSAAREPSPRYLSALEDAVRRSGATALYVEPGASSAAITAFAADNTLEIVELDPMEGAADAPYDLILRRNAQTIADHQR